jgi:hypothetical protein
MSTYKTSGWQWSSFILGPFWYLSKGMVSKGIWLLILCIMTFLCAVPFVWIYCGARGKGDWYNYRLKEKSRIDLNTL